MDRRKCDFTSELRHKIPSSLKWRGGMESAVGKKFQLTTTLEEVFALWLLRQMAEWQNEIIFLGSNFCQKKNILKTNRLGYPPATR